MSYLIVTCFMVISLLGCTTAYKPPTKAELERRSYVLLGVMNEDGTWIKGKVKDRSNLKTPEQMVQSYYAERDWKKNEAMRVLIKYPRLMPVAKKLGRPAFQQVLWMMRKKGKKVEDYMDDGEVDYSNPSENTIHPELLEMIDKSQSRSG